MHSIAAGELIGWRGAGTDPKRPQIEYANRARPEMKSKLIALFLIVICSAASAEDARKGYVLKPSEGEALGPNRLIKASPESGTQGGVVVLDQLQPGFQTTFHVHTNADEFFYVVSGYGHAEFGGKKLSIGPGDVIFVPAGAEHNMSVSEDGPMEMLFFLDRPGIAGWFREVHEKFFSKSLRLSVDDCNKIGEKYNYVCVEQ